MIIYISNINEFINFNKQISDSAFKLITESRKKRIKSYLRTHDKTRCLVSGLLLRRFCGVTDDSQLKYGKYGKPYLTTPAQNCNVNQINDRPPYRFNLSHSGDYVVLATSDLEMGVDIEKVKPYSVSVAKRCFTIHELEWLQNQKNDESFYFLWTAKESIMKASGLGFSISPNSFCVLPIEPGAHGAHIISGKTWFLNWLPFDGHIICYALADKAKEVKIITVKSEDLLI